MKIKITPGLKCNIVIAAIGLVCFLGLCTSLFYQEGMGVGEKAITLLFGLMAIFFGTLCSESLGYLITGLIITPAICVAISFKADVYFALVLVLNVISGFCIANILDAVKNNHQEPI